MIVIDTMVLAYFLLRYPGFTGEVDRFFAEGSHPCAPALWRSELRSVLMQYIRAGRKSALGKDLGRSEATALMADAEALLAGATFEVSSEDVFRLAEASGCSTYDCEYVALAQDLNTRLLTYDRALLEAFPETAVQPSDYPADS